MTPPGQRQGQQLAMKSMILSKRFAIKKNFVLTGGFHCIVHKRGGDLISCTHSLSVLVILAEFSELLMKEEILHNRHCHWTFIALELADKSKFLSQLEQKVNHRFPETNLLPVIKWINKYSWNQMSLFLSKSCTLQIEQDDT